MDELIAKLEKATGPDRELDCLLWAEHDGRDVREANNGLLLAKSRRPPHDECRLGMYSAHAIGAGRNFYTAGQKPPIPLYTASIDVALTLVPEGWWVVLRLMKNAGAERGYYHCDLERDADIAGRDLDEKEEEVISSRNMPSSAIAICIAALKARSRS